MEQAIEHLGASKKLERSREGCAKMDGGGKKRKSAVNQNILLNSVRPRTENNSAI